MKKVIHGIALACALASSSLGTARPVGIQNHMGTLANVACLEANSGMVLDFNEARFNGFNQIDLTKLLSEHGWDHQSGAALVGVKLYGDASHQFGSVTLNVGEYVSARRRIGRIHHYHGVYLANPAPGGDGDWIVSLSGDVTVHRMEIVLRR